MTLIQGVDSSFDVLTEAEADRLVSIGIRAFMQCLWTGGGQPAPRVQNLQVARSRGLIILGYASISPGHSGDWHMDRAREGLPDDLWAALVRVPVDVELQGNTFWQVLQAHDRLAVMGKKPDVYTNYNTWVNLLGNPRRVEGTGLLNAYWDNNPDMDFPSLPFGGWQASEVWGEQWQGDCYVEGQFVDRDTFVLEALQPAAQFVPTARQMADTGIEIGYFALREWNVNELPDFAKGTIDWLHDQIH